MTTARSPSEVACYLIREHDVLAFYGDFRPLGVDLDLHILSCGLQYDPLARQLLLDGLIALALHLCARPAGEHVGWTVSIQRPAMNLFFTGDASETTVVGRVFLGGVEPRSHNVLISQTTSVHSEARRSSVDVEGIDIFAMVERYYRQSEQRPARFFASEAQSALVLGLPDADGRWIANLSDREVFRLPSRGEGLLSRRRVSLRCGCDRLKITNALVGIYGGMTDDLFRSDPAVEVECPRCGARVVVTRGDYDRARETS